MSDNGSISIGWHHMNKHYAPRYESALTKSSLMCGFMATLTCTRSYHRLPQFPRFGYASILLLIQGVLRFVVAQKCSQCAQNFHTPLHGCLELEINPQIQPKIMN